MSQERPRQRRSFSIHQTFASTVPCPICGKKFGVNKVAEHADRCASRLEDVPEHRKPHYSITRTRSERRNGSQSQHSRSSSSLALSDSVPESTKAVATPNPVANFQSETVTQKRKQAHCFISQESSTAEAEAGPQVNATAHGGAHCLVLPGDNSSDEAQSIPHNADDDSSSNFEGVWSTQTIGGISFRLKDLPTKLQPPVLSFDKHMHRYGLAKASLTHTRPLANNIQNSEVGVEPAANSDPNTTPTKRHKTKHPDIEDPLNTAEARSNPSSTTPDSSSLKSVPKLLGTRMDDIPNHTQSSDVSFSGIAKVGFGLEVEPSGVQSNAGTIKSPQNKRIRIASAKAEQKQQQARSSRNVLSHHASSTSARTQILKALLPDYRTPPMTAAQMATTEQTVHKAKLLVEHVKELLKDDSCKLKEFYSIVLQSSTQFLVGLSPHGFQDTTINILVAFQKLFEQNDDIIDKLVDFMPKKRNRTNLQDRYRTLTYPLIPRLPPRASPMPMARYSSSAPAWWSVSGQLLSAPNPDRNPNPNCTPKPSRRCKRDQGGSLHPCASNQSFGRQIISQPFSDSYSRSTLFHYPYPTYTHPLSHPPIPLPTPTHTIHAHTHPYTPAHQLQPTYQVLLPLAAGHPHPHPHPHIRGRRSGSGKG